MSAATTSRGNVSETNKLLEEKEKDLELAAKIGQSLLEQNRELQNKNDFLEDSLNASNDAIVQLRHELNMRMSLLHVYADYDDDFDACGSRERRSNVEHLQRRMKKLENENITLKSETNSLKKHSVSLEEKERLHITECAKQLDSANEKISRLQCLICEKNEECAVQGADVEKLLREVVTRGAHEKSLVSENEDLHAQLQEALSMHEELSTEVVELQERYAEVMSMLHDAEEELRTFRHNQSSHRAASADSLYDSLASELEASDSGFYSTITSARTDCVSDVTKSDAKCLHDELEKMRSKESNEPIVESPSQLPIPGSRTRSVAISTDPPPMSEDRSRKISHNTDDVVDVPSALLAELVKTSKSMEQPQLLSPAYEQPSSQLRVGMDESTQNRPEIETGVMLDQREMVSGGEGSEPATILGVTLSPLARSTPLDGNSPAVKRGMSDTSSDESATLHVWSPRDGMKRVRNGNSSSSSANGSLSKAASSDSLSGYEGPKMGEPGKPGTRDLDFSIRRLNVRRQFQVEREYARFRKERGLAPLCMPFFPPHIPIKKRLPSCFLRNASLHHNEPRKLFNEDTSRVFQRWRDASNVGLLAAIRDGMAQGVFQRSALPPSTPPSTPVHRRYFNGTSVHRAMRASSGIVDALGLCTPCVTPLQLPLKPFLRQSTCDNLISQPKAGIFTRSTS